MKRILPTILLQFLLLVQLNSQDLILQLDKHHSSLNFSIDYLALMKQKGSFDKFDCIVIYDEAKAMPKSVTLVVEMGSIDTNNRVRDQHLISPDFLNAEKFPKAVFQSQSIERAGDGGFEVNGLLNLNGVEKQIQFHLLEEYPLTDDRLKSRRVGFTGSIQVDRKAFGIIGGNAHNSRFNIKDQIVGDIADFSFSIQSIYAIGTDWPPAVAMLKEFEEEGIETIVDRYEPALVKMESDPKSVNEQEGIQAIAVMELAKILIHTNRGREAIRLLNNLNNYENTLTIKGKLTLLEAYALEGDKVRTKKMIEKLETNYPFSALVLELSRLTN